VFARHQSGERGTPRFTAFLRLFLSCSARISVLNKLWLTDTHAMTSLTIEYATRVRLAESATLGPETRANCTLTPYSCSSVQGNYVDCTSERIKVEYTCSPVVVAALAYCRVHAWRVSPVVHLSMSGALLSSSGLSRHSVPFVSAMRWSPV
jgi:hypothetical protein